MVDIFFEVLGFIGIVLSAALYFVPSLIAYRRQDKNLLSLFIFNLLLGFTFVGWVIAMSYATRGISFSSINNSKE